MLKKFEINRTKIKGGCQSGRKVVTHDSKSDLPLVCFEDTYFFDWRLSNFFQIDQDEYQYNYPYHVPVMTENLDHISWLWTFIDLQCKNDVYSLAAEQG